MDPSLLYYSRDRYFQALPFFITLPLSCIILNINQRRKTGEVWEQSYLGTGAQAGQVLIFSHIYVASLSWRSGYCIWHDPSPFIFLSFFFLCLCHTSSSLSFITVPFPVFLVLRHAHVLPVRINPYIGNNVRQMYIPYLKHVIQSSPRNSILRIYGWIQLNGKQTLPN